MATHRGVTTRSLTPLIVVLGPTASGKSKWGNTFAKKYSGEIISADSRQIYKYFSIGTNKEKGEWKKEGTSRVYKVDGNSYHLIDFASPRAYFSVYEYQKMAKAVIEGIINRGNIPFLAGGTGMYIDALVDNWKLTKESYKKTFRKELQAKSNIELLRRLAGNDVTTAKTIDVHNRARLIRAIEIVELTGKPKGSAPEKGEPLYRVLKIGILIDREKLYKKINMRVERMFREGLQEEVESLSKKYPNDLPVFFSLGYKELLEYFNGTMSLDKAKESIKQNTRHYAKRQITWWRRYKDIIWCKTKEEAEKYIQEFLRK